MIQSMTGFGKQTIERSDKVITIEIRSLNSKQADVNLKTPQLYKEKDLEIRSLLSEKLMRGKIDLALFIENIKGQVNFRINHETAINYYEELKKLARTIDEIDSNSYLPLIIKLPEVLQPESTELDPEEWESVKGGINNAIDQLIEYRIEEGSRLEEDITKRIHSISEHLLQIDPFEQDRKVFMKDKLLKELNSIPNHVDENRLEQELIYYIEKFDITEEKVRLKKHCEYFLETVQDEKTAGKKLGFISQEIGREINTIGSKANEANIQKIVVQMKDELEKIKEQLANIL